MSWNTSLDQYMIDHPQNAMILVPNLHISLMTKYHMNVTVLPKEALIKISTLLSNIDFKTILHYLKFANNDSLKMLHYLIIDNVDISILSRSINVLKHCDNFNQCINYVNFCKIFVDHNKCYLGCKYHTFKNIHST